MADNKPSGSLSHSGSDDRAVWNVLFGVWSYPAILVAHQLGIYALLAKRPLTLEELARVKGLKPRPAKALLAFSAALGFVVRNSDGAYALTQTGTDYLVPDSPYYFGHFFDGVISLSNLFTYESIRNAVLTDSPQGYFGEGLDPFEAHKQQNDAMVRFSRAMHSASMAPATGWPRAVDLSNHRRMLDIGGGSGAHSIGAVRQWPQLNSIVFDLAPVCAVADEFIAREGLGSRISTCAGDFFTDPLPPADLHFYGMIFHDWPADRCRALARRSFESLPAGGRIIVHEILFNDDFTGPFSAAAFNINMLTLMRGEQYSGAEITLFLGGAGFAEVEVKPSFGYFSIATGVKL